MKRRLQFTVILLLTGLGQSQVVDRMVAVVDKRVILESELVQAARVEFLMQGKPLSSFTPADNTAVLERLIDRALLEEQILSPAMLDPNAEELAARVKEVRDGIPAAAGPGDSRWTAVLASYGLTQQDLEEQLVAQVRILRFIDLRFRGLVRVEKDAVEAYYQDKFLPEVRKRNAPAPALATVSGKIEQILAEERIGTLLDNWLKALRAQAHIERMLPAPPASAGGSTP